jgi:hypothetical protein
MEFRHRARNYTRDEVLAEHGWNFAIERAILSPLTAVPAFGFTQKFALPTEPYCLRVLQLEDIDDSFRVEGRFLLSDVSSANVIYVKRVVDAQSFSPLFATALQYRLAHKLARAITSKTTLSQEMYQLYQMSLKEARGMNAQEGTPVVLSSTALTEVR